MAKSGDHFKNQVLVYVSICNILALLCQHDIHVTKNIQTSSLNNCTVISIFINVE